MKAVLMSIQPRWVELIASGKKTVEVRKTKPKLDVPFKVYIYETKDKRFENIGVYGWKEDGTAYNYIHNGGKVIGEFVCDSIYHYRYTKPFLYYGKKMHHTNQYCTNACLSWQELEDYLGNKDGYGWHISNLVIYDKPRELGEFYNLCDGYCFDSAKKHKCASFNLDNPYSCNNMKPLKRPPQSWCYVEEVKPYGT